MILGLSASIIAIRSSGLSSKYFIALFAGIAMLACLLPLIGRYRLLSEVLLVLFAMSIPLNLDINFMYQRHEGGALAFTLSLSILGAGAVVLHRMILSPSTRPSTWSVAPLFFVPTLVYMASGIVSLVNAIDANLVYFELFRLTTLLIVLWAVAGIQDPARLKRFIAFLGLGVMMQSCLALVQYKTGKNLGLGIFGEKELVEQFIGVKINRATGTVGHPNILAYYFEILMPLILAMFLVEKNRWIKLYYLLLLPFGAAGLFTTLSRAAWLATAISLPAVLIVLHGKKLFRMNTLGTLFLLGTVMMVPLYYAFPTIERRFTHTDYGSSSLRMPLNKAALSIIEQYPVIGVGMNNLGEVFSRYDQTGHTRVLKGAKNVVHNLYLLVWAEVGTVGFFAFLSIFGSLFFSAGHLFSQVSEAYRGMLVGIAAGIGAHLLHGLFDPGFKANLPVSVLIYSLIGVVGSVDIICRRQSRRLSTGTRESPAPYRSDSQKRRSSFMNTTIHQSED